MKKITFQQLINVCKQAFDEVIDNDLTNKEKELVRQYFVRGFNEAINFAKLHTGLKIDFKN